MYFVRLSSNEFRRRPSLVRAFLKELTTQPTGPALKTIVNAPVGTILSAYDGSLRTNDYRQLRFATCARHVRAMYFELWKSCDLNDNQWFLDRAYLTLFFVERPDKEVELLSLHCDPEAIERDGKPHSDYKSGPHIHIKTAADPMPKAHFALADGYINEVLRDVKSLTNALKRSLQMIRVEVLNRY